jgi:NADPH-dependent F420 reductase
MLEGKTIAVLGGTGNLGAALARRWAKSGLTVIIGSRSAESAEKAAAELGFGLTGAANAAASARADVIVLTVPFAAQAATLETIREAARGKIVIDTTVPLVPPRVMRVQLPPEQSAAVRAQQILGDEVKVISAFHNVAAHKLMRDDPVECDVLVFGDEASSRKIGVALAEAAGLRGLHAGALVNSTAAEALTSVLIFLNKTYKVDGAGLKISGELIPPEL